VKGLLRISLEDKDDDFEDNLYNMDNFSAAHRDAVSNGCPSCPGCLPTGSSGNPMVFSGNPMVFSRNVMGFRRKVMVFWNYSLDFWYYSLSNWN
jgi:hypothetical protein